VDEIGEVGLVTEKKRISNYFSVRLYGFKIINLFLKFPYKVKLTNNEKYIATMCNKLIREKLKGTSFFTENSSLSLFAPPKNTNRLENITRNNYINNK
jgi:hypothetical protein